MRKVLLIAAAMVLLDGCKMKKEAVTKESSITTTDKRMTVADQFLRDSIVIQAGRTDTFYVEKIRPESNSVSLDNPCDSVTGLLKKFQLQAGKTRVVSDGQSIKVDTECEELIRYYQSENQWASSYISSMESKQDSLLIYYHSDEYVNSVQKVTEVPWWSWVTFWVVLVGLGVIWLVFKVIV